MIEKLIKRIENIKDDRSITLSHNEAKQLLSELKNLQNWQNEKENNLEKSTKQALTIPIVMPRFLPEFIDWIYMSAYEQIDFGKFKKWYTNEALEAYENKTIPEFEIDQNIYTTEQLYEKCKEDIGYWESLSGAQR
jgi:chromatin segregation and condensation protein Rec8/ScpA/Scc1 (kleisin family)